jgi:hypothetical protein
LNRRPTVYETVALPLSYIGFSANQIQLEAETLYQKNVSRSND